MKTLLLSIFGALVLAQPVHAAPNLVVEATLTEQHADGSKKIFHPRPVTVVPGGKAVFSLGAYEMDIAPELKDRGRVIIPMLMTRGPAANLRMVSRPTLITRLGVVGQVGTGDLTFTVVVNRAQ